jgi:hypothetical protein
MFNLFKDQQLLSDVELFLKVHEENKRQVEKWGVQRHTSFEWLTYTAEELGSLAKAIGEYEHRGGPAERVVDEAIQVATLALKIAEMFMIGKEKIPTWEKGR